MLDPAGYLDSEIATLFLSLYFNYEAVYIYNEESHKKGK